MKITNIAGLLLMLLALYSCGGEQGAESSAADVQEKLDTTEATAYNYLNQGFSIPQHDCDLIGEILDENQVLSQQGNNLIIIKSDSTTFDSDLNINSHRILEIYNVEDCSLVDSQVLPVNYSADYPYYIARVSYNTNSKLIAIRGFNNFYIYDLKKGELLPEFKPEFVQERFGVDAQSGRILRIELWENYLIGYAQDYGAFAFNLTENTELQPALPYAEWFSTDETFHSLFLLSFEDGGQQILLPEFDFDKGVFKINPLFEEPHDIKTESSSGPMDNRFVVFSTKSDNGLSIAVDLKEKKLVDLPQNIAQGKNEAILNWVEENN